MLRFALCALALLSLSSTFASSSLIRKNHIGALNYHLRHSLHTSLPTDPPAQYFTQHLSHFDPANPTTFQQKYYVNDTFFVPNTNAPVFIMLGGEGPVVPAYVTGGFAITEYAQRFGALVVALEHRFYGETIPNNDSSTTNLRFLSSQQALADAARFHDHIAQQYNTTGRWIVFGGSYSGNLSAWLKLKYPHLFAGSIAASAPVRAQLDFPEYFEVVSRSVGETCSTRIQEASDQLSTLLGTSEGKIKLQQLFNTCTPLETDLDVSIFVRSLSNPISEAVQYNADFKANEFIIRQICEILENSSSDAVQSMFNLYTAYKEKTGVPSTQCMEVSYTQIIQDMQPTSDGRSWMYQTCIEFGYYQTSDAKDQPFGPQITLSSFTQQCIDIFGVPVVEDSIDWTNEDYGGKEISTENTLFTNGNIDPWHALGMTNATDILSSENSVGVIYMNGTAHCADLYWPSDDEVPDLKAARIVQVKAIAQWLGVPEPAM